MESNFNNRDFERFVKQNADQYRMFPSEKVWYNIHGALHTRRRWYGIALALLLITTTVVTWVMLVPDNRSEKLASISSLQIGTAIKPGNSDELPSIAETGPVKIAEPKTAFIVTAVTLQKDPFPLNPSAADYAHVEEVKDIVETETGNDLENAPVTMVKPEAITRAVLPQASNSRKENKPVAVSSLSIAIKEVSNIATLDKPAEEPAADQKKEETANMKLPVIPERVEKELIKSSAKKKLSWHAYLTPTVSYRDLKENTDYLAAARYNNILNGTPNPYSTDVNTVVTHRPDLGFQLGVRTAYPLSQWFSITGGLQLSVSKYDIKAYITRRN